MVKVRFGKTEYEAIKKFEKLHHDDLWKWICNKINGAEEMGRKINILDISDEPSVFSVMLAERFPENMVTCVIKSSMPNIPLTSNVSSVIINELNDLKKLNKKYDVIIFKEFTSESGKLDKLLSEWKKLLASNDGMILLLVRPEDSPLPIPESCLEHWSKTAVSTDDIIAASKTAGMKLDIYKAKIPVKVERFDWQSILSSGCLPAVKFTKNCTARDISDYCMDQSGMIKFDEEFSIFLLF